MSDTDRSTGEAMVNRKKQHRAYIPVEERDSKLHKYKVHRV